MFGRWLTLPRDGPDLIETLPSVANRTACAGLAPAGRLPLPRRHPAAFDWNAFAARARNSGIVCLDIERYLTCLTDGSRSGLR